MIIVFANIITWLQQHQLPCLFKQITHFDCPGCGLQRSSIALLKGDISESLSFYPATIPIAVLFLFTLVQLMVKLKSGTTIIKYLFYSCASIIFIHYIYKTINHINF
jgi:Protein of unknown function (DUF2752)